MRVIVDAIREQEGRLEGTLRAPDGRQGVFSSRLDPSGVGGLDLIRTDAAGPESGDEETHG